MKMRPMTRSEERACFVVEDAQRTERERMRAWKKEHRSCGALFQFFATPKMPRDTCAILRERFIRSEIKSVPYCSDGMCPRLDPAPTEKAEEVEK